MSTSPVVRRRSRSSKPRAAAAPGSRRRPSVGSKISVTVDSAVLHEIRQLVRKTGSSLSAHITDVLERDLRRRRLQQLIEQYEAESGVITEQELAEVRSQWQA